MPPPPTTHVRGRARLRGLLPRRGPEARSCTVAAAARPGFVRALAARPSADRHAVVLRPDADFFLLAAFAGHGVCGARAADVAADVLPAVLARRVLGRDDAHAHAGSEGSDAGEDGYEGEEEVGVEAAMRDAFVEASIAVDACEFAAHSGTTATVAVVRGGVLTVGSVGDGVVLLGRRRGAVVTLQAVGKAHTAGSVVERARVERFGGMVSEGGFVGDGDETRSMKVTRALGDTGMRKVGVCQLPQIGCVELTHRDGVVAVGTTGLWDGGEGTEAPEALGRVVNEARAGGCGPFQLARGLLDEAFGRDGPEKDATLVCMLLKR